MTNSAVPDPSIGNGFCHRTFSGGIRFVNLVFMFVSCRFPFFFTFIKFICVRKVFCARVCICEWLCVCAAVYVLHENCRCFWYLLRLVCGFPCLTLLFFHSLLARYFSRILKVVIR